MVKKRLAGWVCIALLLACGAGTAADPETWDVLEELKLYSKAMGAILEGYVGDVKARELLYKAVSGMLANFDPYTEFIDPEKYELLKIGMKGEYAGIGVKLEIVDNVPAVLEVQPGSAAEKAGVQVHDKIMQVDGAAMKGLAIAEVAHLLRGEEGIPVRLQIWRQVTKKFIDMKVVREKIEIMSVRDARMVGRELGYFWITDFQQNTTQQAEKALNALLSQGMKALIIDLRNNEGGLMTEAVELAERFLPAGKKIVSVQSKIPEQRKEYVSSGKSALKQFPVLLLVNQVSASAAEIFSVALQENGRAQVIGVKTYGKASVQSVVPLDDVSAMKLTTARYLSPSGKAIDGVGIEPDVFMEYSIAGQSGEDHQVRTALDIFKEYL